MDGDYDSDGDSDKRQLHRQQRYKMVCIRKLCGNGMQKKREIFFSSTLCFFPLSSSSSSSFKATTRATHYMTTNSKTHWSAQPRCYPQNPCTRIENIYGVTSLGTNFVLQSNLLCVCVCVYVLPRPKVGSKTSFGDAHSFFPLKF